MDIRNFFGKREKQGDHNNVTDLTQDESNNTVQGPSTRTKTKNISEIDAKVQQGKMDGHADPAKLSLPQSSLKLEDAMKIAIAALPAEDKLKMSLLSNSSYLGRAPDEPPNLGIRDQPPKGHPDALSGMTFVISGVLDSMLRDETERYIQRHGGRVTSSVSGKTAFLLVGEHTGKSKYHAAKEKGVKIIDEDGLRALVAASIPAISQCKTQSEKNEVIGNEKKAEASRLGEYSEKDSLLWVDKWKPQSSSELIGNPGLVGILTSWMKNWDAIHLHGEKGSVLSKGSRSMDFKKKAVLLSGSPGIGKTSAALIIARECGLEPIEVNASDTRSKSDSVVLKGVSGKLSNMVKEMSTNSSLSLGSGNKGKKPCLIMDEVDGMSAGDRGGIADLIKTINKTKVPIIAICNDKYSPKLRSLRNHCLELDFRKPTVQQIQKRLMKICSVEGLKMNDATMAALIQSANGGDIRLLLGQLQMIRRRTDHIAYDDVAGTSMNSKDIEMSPFEAAAKLLDMTTSTSLTLADQIDLVFHDADLVPLLVQENYINHRPKIALNDEQRMAVVAKAANEFSAGDLVSRSVRQFQNWTLMPFACALGTVAPATYARGPRETFGLYPGEQNFPRFSAWLGQNSSYGKQKRILGEVHTNFISSGAFVVDRLALRLEYFHVLRKALTQPLLAYGKSGISSLISFMNKYCMRREDLDSIMEITKFKTKAAWGEDPYKAIETSVKSAFTRAFNQSNNKQKNRVGPKSSKDRRKANQDVESDPYELMEGSGLATEDEEDEEKVFAPVDTRDLKRKFSDIQGSHGIEVSVAEKIATKKVKKGRK